MGFNKFDARRRVLVTGASGFVGEHLVSFLRKSGYNVLAGKRHVGSNEVDAVAFDLEQHPVIDSRLLQGVDVIIHAAAITSAGRQDEELCQAVNVAGTIELARSAVKAGVRRFVFLSSLKVNGESSGAKSCFSDGASLRPQGTYACSKAEAEKALQEVARSEAMEIVVIRPPIIYGPGVKGNFKKLMLLVNKGVPLPLLSINNRRSIVYIGNLCSLIERTVDSTTVTNRALFVSDGKDLSTSDLLLLLKKTSRSKAMIFPVPEKVLWFLFTLMNKKEIRERLLGSLCVDITETTQLLDWKPPFSVEEGIRATVLG
jgi:nucleoside-diphosphate-sugar epimerase